MNLFQNRTHLGHALITVFFLIAIFSPTELLAATSTWVGTTTSWNVAANWSPIGVPPSGNDVIIPTAPTGGQFPIITSGDSIVISNLTINSGATLTQNGGKIQIHDFLVGSGGTYTQSAGTLFMEHDWKNSGTFNSTGGTVDFIGSAGGPDFSLGSNQFYNIIIEAGKDPKFDNTVSTISVAGNFTNYNTGLDMSNKSTIVFNGTGTQTITSAAASDKRTFGSLTVNKPSGTVSLASNITVDLNVTVSSGTLDLGTSTLKNKSSNTGTLTVANGATLNVGGSFPAPPNFGSVSLGTSSTVIYSGANQTVASGITYGNLIVAGTGRKTAGGNITTAGNLTIQTPDTLDMGASGLLTVQGSLTLNGTLIANNSAGVLVFYSRADGNWDNLATWSATSYSGATAPRLPGGVANDAVIIGNGRTIVLNTNATNLGTIRVDASGKLTCGTSVVSGSGTVIVNSSGTLEIGSTAGITSSGPTGNIQTATRTFSPGGNYIYNGLAAQATGNGLPTVVATLTVNNSSGLTLSGDVAASGSLTMTSGDVSTGVYLLTIGTGTSSTGTLTRTAGRVLGSIKRWFAAATASNILFPIGVGTYYRPANISFTGAPSVGGTLTASFTGSNPGTLGLPLADGGTSVIICAGEGYWTLSAADGLTGGGYSLDLTADGFNNVSDVSTLRILKRVNSSSAWTIDGTHVTGTGTTGAPIVHRSGLSGFSQFGVGGGSDNPLPIELAGFSAFVVNGAGVRLTWATLSETNNFGFEVEKSSLKEAGFVALPNGFVPGKGTTLARQEYSFVDPAPLRGDWYYRLKQQDVDGTVSYSGVVKVTVPDQKQAAVPLTCALSQNYPNPFNPTTTIEFALPAGSHVGLKVHNLLGQEVRTLVDSYLEAGIHRQVFDATGLAGGMYFYKLTAGQYSIVRRLILLN
jgi:hypothetical protein